MEAALTWATLLAGTPYGWWTGGPIPAGAPAWAADGPPPPLGAIKDTSCFCAGIPNLMLRHAGLPVPCEANNEYCGGTGAYGLNFSAVAQEFDIAEADKYPRGTLLGMKYHSVARQGHVVVMLGRGKTAKLLQSTANSGPGGSDPTHPGVHANLTLEDCFRTEEYCKFEYAVLPQHWIDRKPPPSCQDKMFGECGAGITPGFNVTCCPGAHCKPAQKGAPPVCVPGADEPQPAVAAVVLDEDVTQEEAAGAVALVLAVPGCCDFSGIWHNHPDINASIKYNFTQASGSCVVKGLHGCFSYNGSNATGDILHGCPSFYQKHFPGGMTGKLDQKSAAPLDELRWANGVHWYREHGASCAAPEPRAGAAEPQS